MRAPTTPWILTKHRPSRYTISARKDLKPNWRPTGFTFFGSIRPRHARTMAQYHGLGEIYLSEPPVTTNDVQTSLSSQAIGHLGTHRKHDSQRSCTVPTGVKYKTSISSPPSTFCQRVTIGTVGNQMIAWGCRVYDDGDHQGDG